MAISLVARGAQLTWPSTRSRREAVRLDEEVEDRAQSIERLQDLILYNVNSVRPAISRHLGLPPLR